MMQTKTIYENKWVSLKEATLDTGAKYIYSSEPWCGSQGVAVLVYRWVEAMGLDHMEVLGRYEICPAHSDVAELCAITGGLDKIGEAPIEVAVREVYEESGYDVDVYNVRTLGYVKPSKASDKTVHLYSVDVTQLHQGEAVGDGTLGEVGAYTDWVTISQALNSKDPVLATMVARQIAN